MAGAVKPPCARPAQGVVFEGAAKPGGRWISSIYRAHEYFQCEEKLLAKSKLIPNFQLSRTGNRISASGKTQMVGYRCYILDAEDHILQAHDLDCANDAEAADIAEGLLGQDPYHQCAEVWRSTQRVIRLERDPPYPRPSISRLAGRRLGSVV